MATPRGSFPPGANGARGSALETTEGPLRVAAARRLTARRRGRRDARGQAARVRQAVPDRRGARSRARPGSGPRAHRRGRGVPLRPAHRPRRDARPARRAEDHGPRERGLGRRARPRRHRVRAGRAGHRLRRLGLRDVPRLPERRGAALRHAALGRPRAARRLRRALRRPQPAASHPHRRPRSGGGGAAHGRGPHALPGGEEGRRPARGRRHGPRDRRGWPRADGGAVPAVALACAHRRRRPLAGQARDGAGPGRRRGRRPRGRRRRRKAAGGDPGDRAPRRSSTSSARTRASRSAPPPWGSRGTWSSSGSRVARCRSGSSPGRRSRS